MHGKCVNKKKKEITKRKCRIVVIVFVVDLQSGLFAVAR